VRAPRARLAAATASCSAWAKATETATVRRGGRRRVPRPHGVVALLVGVGAASRRGRRQVRARACVPARVTPAPPRARRRLLPLETMFPEHWERGTGTWNAEHYFVKPLGNVSILILYVPNSSLATMFLERYMAVK
jgi:hypothetical protein